MEPYADYTETLAWLDESLDRARAAGRAKTEELLRRVRVEILEEMDFHRRGFDKHDSTTEV